MNNSKLITKIYKLLNSANQTFYKQIKKNKNISDHFKIIGDLYQTIIKNLETISRLTPELQFYKLAAELCYLQCEVNSFELSPVDDNSIQKNENRLKNVTRRIQDFLNLTFQLEPRLKFYGHSKLYTQFYQFKQQLNNYAKNWGKNENNIVAAYTYNYADFLLKANPHSLEKIEKAVIYLEQSSTCYSNNLRYKEKKQTQLKLAEAKALLTQLQPNQTILNASIPFFFFFLTSKIKDETIQSVSIHITPPQLSSKIKPAQPNSPSRPIHNRFLQLSQSKPAKAPLFRPKKIDAVLCQSCLISYKKTLATAHQSEKMETQSSNTLDSYPLAKKSSAF